MAHCEDDGHWCPDCHMETRPSEVRSDALFGVSDPCKTCSDRDKAGDDEPCASCGPPAWEYHDCRCEDDDTPNVPVTRGGTPSRPAAGSILRQHMRCPACSWTGSVNECEPDVDGDGSLGCPRCNAIVESNAEAKPSE